MNQITGSREHISVLRELKFIYNIYKLYIRGFKPRCKSLQLTRFASLSHLISRQREDIVQKRNKYGTSCKRLTCLPTPLYSVGLNYINLPKLYVDLLRHYILWHKQWFIRTYWRFEHWNETNTACVFSNSAPTSMKNTQSTSSGKNIWKCSIHEYFQHI